MIIGIDASRANQACKTGTEWYSYHIIVNLAKIDSKNQYILYTKDPLKDGLKNLGKNFTSRVLKWPPKILWSQIRLSVEMFFNPPDLLFVPAHTLPLIHPKKTVTTCHDVGFERYPQLYAKKEIGGQSSLVKKLLFVLVKILTLGRFGNNELDYHRFAMHFAVKHTTKIITPSFFTAKELIYFYPQAKGKIFTTHLGLNFDIYRKIIDQTAITAVLNKFSLKLPFIVFTGRLEQKKNITGTIETFYQFKRKFKLKHQLVLIGKPGYGFEIAEKLIQEYNFQNEVKQIGWVEDHDIALIYNAADALLFLSHYEGFGFPPLEAQACGLPVLASDRGSLPEVLSDSAVLVAAESSEKAAVELYRLIKNQDLRRQLIEKGLARVKMYSWQKCAKKTLEILETS